MTEKITKAKAGYVEHANAKQCKDCHMYIKSKQCSLVIGIINPGGSCKYWEGKLPVEKSPGS